MVRSFLGGLVVGRALATALGSPIDSSAPQMPVAELKPEYLEEARQIRDAAPLTVPTNGSDYVFLQRFGLGIPSPNLTFHTEVLVCPRAGFSPDDQKTLDATISGMTDFAEIDLSWWSARSANCVELGYGGAACFKECCAVPHTAEQTAYPLNTRRAVIGNADVATKRLYVYGTGAFDGNTAYHYACDHKCWSSWSGIRYNPLTNNCNTFTSTILHMVYGLSQKKPHLGISDLVTVHGHCPSSASEREAPATEMPVAELKPEYLDEAQQVRDAAPATVPANGSDYVFLQRFGLGIPSPNLTFHTEVLVCPRAGFSPDDQKTLDATISGMADFAEVDPSWWSARSANCVELGYGGAACIKECCAVPHTAEQTAYPLNTRRAVIGNADVATKRLYVYGTGGFDGNTAYHYACDHKCWSSWSGIRYNPLTNNCNTFTSTILHMVYGLSQKKPHLGISDLVTVHGHCPTSASEPEAPATEVFV